MGLKAVASGADCFGIFPCATFLSRLMPARCFWFTSFIESTESERDASRWCCEAIDVFLLDDRMVDQF